MATLTKATIPATPAPTVPVSAPAPPSHCCVAGCRTCQPHRVAHWRCAQCGGGPYKFAATDPGPYKILRPHFERTAQDYRMNEQGVGRWHYDVRRVCSPGCWAKESRRVQRDEAALAERRPDLAPAIEAKLEAEQDADAVEWQDDLHPDPGQF